MEYNIVFKDMKDNRIIKTIKKVLFVFSLICIFAFSLSACSKRNVGLDINGTYTSKEDVSLYIYTYKKLPKNYITKEEAKKLGWDSSKGNLWKVAKGKSIGGDRFGNYEKLLPVVDGRNYYECDIDFAGKKRNAKRIVYADDFDESIGFIYYTDDHYKSFERLY